MKLLLLACAGGAIGAGLRFGVTQWFAARGWTELHWATFSINVSGSFLMGLLAAVLMSRTHHLAAEMRVFLATGILGGYTTFSAFSLEAWMLAERGQIVTAGLYVAGSVFLSIAGLGLGLITAKWLFS
jgi:CrcB protein